MGIDPTQSESDGAQPLGELLVGRGLITPAQLEQALAEQRDTKRPIGEIIVRLGFAEGRMIGQALATQHGRMLKSEYGFALGFDATLPETEDSAEVPPVTPRQVEPLRLVAPGQPDGSGEEPAALRIAGPRPQGAVERPAPQLVVPGVPEGGGGEPAALRTAAPGAEEAVESLASQLADPEPEDASPRLQQLAEKLLATTSNLARVEQERATAHAALAENAEVNAELQGRIAEQAARIETLEAELRTAITGAAASADTYQAVVRDLEARIAQVEGDLEQARRERDEAAPGHRETELADAVATLEAACRAHETDKSELRHRVATLQEALEAAGREHDEAASGHGEAALADAVAKLEAACRAHEDDNGEFRRRIATLEDNLEREGRVRPEPQDVSGLEGPLSRAASPAIEAGASSHAVFFLAEGHGYVLLERAGPVPAVGDRVDMSAHSGDKASVVAKVGPSPVPGSDLRCAYLL